MLTGAARGLGLAFAQILGEAGANIAVFDIVEPDAGLKQIESDYGVKVRYYKADVTNRQQVTDVVSKIEEEFGEIDIKSVIHLPYANFICYILTNDPASTLQVS